MRNLILREATKVFATTSNSFAFAFQQFIFMFWMRCLLRFTLLVIQPTLQVNKLNVILKVSLRRANESVADAISLSCLFYSLLWKPAMDLIYISGVCASTSEVIHYGGFCDKVLLDSDWASQLGSVLQFLSRALRTRIISDDNKRVQFPRFE